ncbi:glycosyltransferase family 39 protein (plasmid) [Microbulbifer sp. SSSA002]|uniref:glycosyltransferase family 39 protein n=1 Tax=Microbulbifer sp. SSSA002 TaxID=3243376 RepID=UPI004039FBDC
MPEETVSTRFWWRPAGVVVLIAGYLLLHLLLRGYFSPTLSTDDMFENVFVQELKLGYQVRQPPVYEWLLYGVQKIFGPTIWSFLVLKYSLVLCFALFLYGVARQAIANEKLAALAVFSWVAFYQIGFNLHEGVTHTAVLMAASAATVYCFLVGAAGQDGRSGGVSGSCCWFGDALKALLRSGACRDVSGGLK